MKPSNLTPPCSREDRRCLMHDRVWYVPKHLPESGIVSDFVFPGWDHPDFFGNQHPVNVEYCSGSGAWIAEKACQYPEYNWVAVEKKFDRVRKLWAKIHNLNLKNMIVLCGEGFLATEKYFPTSSIQDVYINFPDPWPKRHHARHRIIQQPFLHEMSRILIPRGKVTFVTDDAPYSEWFIEEMKACGQFETKHPYPYYLTDQNDYGASYFDTLWRSKGRIIYYHEYQKGCR